MRICFAYNEYAYGSHRKPLDFGDIEGCVLTGSDLAFAKHAEQLARRGHDVAAYVPRIHPHRSPEGIQVRSLDALEGDLKVESFDAAIALGNPNDLRLFPTATLRVLNRQCSRFGGDCHSDWQSFTDLVTCPSEPATAWVQKQDLAGKPLSVPFATLENGCDPKSYAEGVRVPGRVVYTSCPDRGLHLLLQAWPQIKKACPEAELRIFYGELGRFLDLWTAPGRSGEDARRAHYIKHALKKLAPLGVKACGGVSHRELAKELSEATVLAYPCDPITYTETFSVAILEACAAGCVPVISSADALGGLYGAALPLTTVKMPVRERMAEYAATIARGLTEPGFREDVTTRARAFAATLSWEKLGEKLERMLSDLLLVKSRAGEVQTKIAEKRVWAALQDELNRGDAAWVPATEEQITAAETNTDPEKFASATESTWAPEPEKPVLETRVSKPGRKPVLHMVLSRYSSGDVPIDLEDPDYENEGGGCRAGFMGLVRALAKRGDYQIRAFSTYKQTGKRADGVEYCTVDRSSLTVGKPDAVLSYYDARPLIGLTGMLRIASHHTFNLGPWVGALEWCDVNLAPCQYVAEALRRVYDETGAWHVLPNASPDIPRVCPQVPGRVIYHTSASRGLHDLLRMWPEIKRQVPHATLHVVGNVVGGKDSWAEQFRGKTGRSADNANAIIAEVPKVINLGVSFLGFLPRKQLVRELCEASCFAFPASTVGPAETFSISILECLKLGCPVVLRPCDALESVWGEHVPICETLSEFPLAVSQMLTMPDVRDRWIEAGRKYARRFTYERAADSLDTILQGHLRLRAGGRKVVNGAGELLGASPS